MAEVSEDRIWSREPRRTGSVLIVGVGSVGSYMADYLAHFGVQFLSFVDPQVLEPENLPRHYLDGRDLGKPKAEALAHRLLEALLYECSTEGLQASFLDIDEDGQRALVNQVDIVVGATDDQECQRRINEICVAERKPAVYPSVWMGRDIDDAEAGSVLRVLPDEVGPCFACAIRWLPPGVRADGMGGTKAEIDPIASLAAQIVMGILDPEDQYGSLIEPDFTETLVHCSLPPSESIAHLFEEGNVRPIQVPLPRTRCPVCGSQAPPQPTPPDPAPDPGWRGGPIPPGTGPPGSTPQRDLANLSVRIAWLLGTIAALVILIRIDGAMDFWGTAIGATRHWGDVPKFLLLSGLDVAAIIFGLYMTFRADDFGSRLPEPAMAWRRVAICVVLLIVNIAVPWPFGPSAPKYLVATMQGQGGYITGVSFSPNGMKVASVSTGGGSFAWSNIDGSNHAQDGGFVGPCGGVAFTPDNAMVVAGCDGYMMVWELGVAADMNGNQEGNTQGQVNDITFSPISATDYNGNQIDPLAVATSVGVELWSYSPSGMAEYAVSGYDTLTPSSPVSSVAYSPNGLLLAGVSDTANNASQRIEIWNTSTGHLFTSFVVPDALQVAFSPNGNTLAISTTTGIQFWNVTSRRLATEITYGPFGSYGPGGAVAYSPNGNILAFSDGFDKIGLWSIPENRQVGSLPTSASGKGWAYALAFSPNGEYLASAGGDAYSNCGNCDDPSVHMWDVSSFTQ